MILILVSSNNRWDCNMDFIEYMNGWVKSEILQGRIMILDRRSFADRLHRNMAR